MSEQASAWVLPNVKGPVVAARGRSPSVGALAESEREAWRLGFEQGRQEGLESVERENAVRVAALDEAVARLGTLCQQLARPIEPLDDGAARELATLALSVGGHLARRELRLDPSQVIAIIRESVELLPLASREVRVRVHPADGAVIRERLSPGTGERAWTLIDDPVMARGGCRVTSEFSAVDARLESRIASVISTVLGDERVSERASVESTGEE
jgi:flagellar assembly protein FliH